MKKFLFIGSLAFILSVNLTNGQIKTSGNIDSTEIVANYFLVFDVFNNSHYCTERDIEELVMEHPKWVLKFFPEILKRYDLILLTQFQLAIELYKKGSKNQLSDLWKKYKRLQRNEEFIPIMNELKSNKISLK